MKNETKTNAHAQGAGRVLRGQGCCSLVVRSVPWCVHLMDNRRTTRKARRRTSQDEGRDKAEKNKSRPQQGGGFSLNLYMPGVWRWSGVISHDISEYIVISHHAMSQDTIYRDIVSISRTFGTDIEIFVSHRNISRYRTLFFAQLGAPSLVHQRIKEMVIWRRNFRSSDIYWKNICTPIWVYSRPTWMPCFETITQPTTRNGHQQERHNFAVVRLQQ